jgi:hypothetical protein
MKIESKQRHVEICLSNNDPFVVNGYRKEINRLIGLFNASWERYVGSFATNDAYVPFHMRVFETPNTIVWLYGTIRSVLISDQQYLLVAYVILGSIEDEKQVDGLSITHTASMAQNNTMEPLYQQAIFQSADKTPHIVRLHVS